MDHRNVSLNFISSTGLIPVKVRPNQKDPFPEWDPRTTRLEDASLVLETLKHKTDMNVGALFFGRHVDIDLDTNAPHLHTALDYFLPRTQYVWGRESKPRSHRVYALDRDFERAEWSHILRYMKGMVENVVDEWSYSIEVRGGKPENGLFSVLPGSTHPSGEKVEWAEGVDPTIGGAHVTTQTLVKCLRLALVAAILSQHWSEGRRNDLSLALAGLLWRVRTSTMAAFGLEANEEPGDGEFLLGENDAEAILKCVMEIAGDDPEDQRSRLINLKNTWRKLDGDAEARVTGGKALGEIIGEGGDLVVQAVYRLLSDNGAAEQIEKLTEQFVMWYGPGVVIDLSLVRAGADIIPWMTRNQASGSLGGKKIVIGQNKIKVVDLLFGSPIIERVHGLTFDPSSTELIVKENGQLKVNQFQGFKMEPHKEKVEDDDIRPFLDYVLNIVADGDQKAADWIIAWCADLFQFPDKKPGTALVLIGVQGAGKSFLGDGVIGPIVGNSHYTQINSITRLTDKFNTTIDNMVFVQCDEAVHSYQKDVASRLKSVITDPYMIIEPKGVNTYKKPNHMRLLFTSNEDMTAMFIDPSPHERRFTVLKVSGEKSNSLGYWTDLRNWVADNRPKIMRYLLDYKYDRKDVRRPYTTQAKRDMQRVSIDPEVAWIINRMADGFILSERAHEHWWHAFSEGNITEKQKKEDELDRSAWPDLVYGIALENDFRAYVRSHGRSVYSGSLLTTIKRVLPEGALKPSRQLSVRTFDAKSGQATQSRVRMLNVPPVEHILDHLRGVYGSMIDELYEQAKIPEIGESAEDEEKEF